MKNSFEIELMMNVADHKRAIDGLLNEDIPLLVPYYYRLNAKILNL
jgi:hypothetical protein